MNRNLWLLAVRRACSSPTTSPSSPSTGWSGWRWRPRLDGDAAGDGLRGRRRAVHRRWWRARRRASGAGARSRSGSRWRCARRCCAPMRPCTRNFWLLCVATVVAGYYNANASLYRFAAAELARAGWREKAVSLVMAGGLIGAVLGPNLAARTRDLVDAPFAGAYVALAGVALLAMVLLASCDFPPVAAPSAARRAAARWRRSAAAGVHRGGARGRAGLRRDEPADGGDADRHADMRPAVFRRRLGAANGT